MTEWNASGYDTISALQKTMAEEALSLLKLEGTERILDVGCGNGKITAEIASRLPHGNVVGVDAPAAMIAFASSHFDSALHPNLRFEAADARRLAFHSEFDLVVSFNALHWIPQQDQPLRGIHAALKPDAIAQLRLVPKGPRKSLENVLEEARSSPRWIRYFGNFHDPYLHLTPEQYASLAQENGFRIRELHTSDKAWDFRSRAAFDAFGSVTFVEWTQHLPEEEKPSFITDVLDRYRKVAAEKPGEENTFKFYQMDITLTRA